MVNAEGLGVGIKYGSLDKDLLIANGLVAVTLL